MENSKEPGPVNRKRKTEQSDTKQQRQLFLASALSMSWQLAIVVLVPIIGGYELDQHLKTTPLLTIIGFVVAMAGTYGILRTVLREFNTTTNKPKADKQ